MNKNIIQIIKKEFDTCYQDYDFIKYNEDLYKSFLKPFASLEPSNTLIMNAINWKYGNLNKSNTPKSHQLIIKQIQNLWPRFVKSNQTKTEIETFSWWLENLRKGNSKRYITVSFITHLVHNENSFPIIDQHNFRALNYFQKYLNSEYDFKKYPSNYDDILQLKSFILQLKKHLNNKNLSEIDKFLMMYGKKIKKKLK